LNTLIDEGSGHKSEPESTEDLSDRSGRLVTPSVKPYIERKNQAVLTLINNKLSHYRLK